MKFQEDAIGLVDAIGKVFGAKKEDRNVVPFPRFLAELDACQLVRLAIFCRDLDAACFEVSLPERRSCELDCVGMFAMVEKTGDERNGFTTASIGEELHFDPRLPGCVERKDHVIVLFGIEAESG